MILLIAVGLLLLSLLLPAIARHRAGARMSGCANNLMQMGLGVHNYHAAYDRLPRCGTGTDPGSSDTPLLGNGRRLSAFVGLLPFVEQNELWQKISSPFAYKGKAFPAMGPYPTYDAKLFPPWGERPSLFVCPSDKAATKFGLASSYVVNFGDGILDIGAPLDPVLPPYGNDRSTRRGVFVFGQSLGFRDCLDGMVNTLLFSEAKIAGSPVAKSVSGLPLNPTRVIESSKNRAGQFWPEGREAVWTDGYIRSTGFQTVLPPNSPSATSDKGELEAVMSASSHHFGGVHVLFLDGHYKFVLNSIDAGSSTTPSVAASVKQEYTPPGSRSPYGVWGALGTRASQEIVDLNIPEITNPPIERTASDLKALQSLPLETWTAANGTSKLKARLVAIERRSLLIFLTQANELKPVPLTALASEDAFHAVETIVQRQRDSIGGLTRQLKEAVAMLEAKQFDQFFDRFISADLAPPEHRSQVIAEIRATRGIFIYVLDASIRQLESPAGIAQLRIDESTGAVRFDASFFPRKAPDFTFVPVGSEWKLVR